MVDGRKFNGTSVSRNAWSKVEDLTLRRYYTEPRVSWDELCRMLPKRSRDTIYVRARKLGLHRRRSTKSSANPIIKRLWELREKEGITRAQLAKKVGYHEGMIARWESGKTMPTLLRVMDWCEALVAELKVIYRGTPIEPSEREGDDFPALPGPETYLSVSGGK